MSAQSVAVRILVWDVPVRVFHWLMVLCFAGAYITSESERWRLVHVTLGYTLGGLVAFRLLWGLVGTRYARFTSFVRGPAAVLRYLKSLFIGEPEHHVGHNPAGAVAIVLLLLMGLGLVASGYSIYNDIGGEWLEEVHEVLGNGMLVLVLGHVAGVASASWLHRENLARSMVSGYKQGDARQGIGSPWRVVGVLLLAAVLGFWWLQWRSAPAASESSSVSAVRAVALAVSDSQAH